MRIPRAHNLTLEYCALFDLPMRPFVMGNPKGLVYVGGQRMTAAEANEHPERLPFNLRRRSTVVPRTTCGRRRSPSCSEMVEHEGEQAWPEIVKRYDEYSLYEFLRQQGLQPGRDRVLRGHELRRERPAQLVRRGAARGARRRVRRYADDRWRHGRAAQRVLSRAARTCVRFGDGGALDRSRMPDGVTLHCRIGPDRVSFNGDYVICTLPFSVLRPIEATSHARRNAPSGSSTTTRRPRSCSRCATDSGSRRTASSAARRSPTCRFRRMNYPPDDPTTSRGVLLASYTWGQDALQWGAMDEETRVEEALDDVVADPPAHPRGVRGRRVARLVQRPVGARRVRALRARAADDAPGRDPQDGRPGLLRGRALLAVSRVDPGRARVAASAPRARSTSWQQPEAMT